MIDEFVTWGTDYTPSIDCARCGAELIAEPNGNAPLYFYLGALITAAAEHDCPKQVQP